MAGQEEDEFGAFLKTQEPSISTSQDIDEKMGDDSEEDEFSQFLKTAEEPKKETVTPIAEKEIEEPAGVAQNGIPEEQVQSSQSVLPSIDIGSDSPLSEDEAPVVQEQAPQEPFSVLGFEEGVSVPFKNVAEEKANVAENLEKAKVAQSKDPLAIKEGTKMYGDLEAILAPRMTNEKDIEATLDEIQNDQGFSPQQSEAAQIMAIQKKDLLLEQYESGKIEQRERVFKNELGKVKEEAGDNVENYIRREKKKVSEDAVLRDEVKKEYKLNESIDDLTSEDSVKGALTLMVTPHNAYVKLAAIDRSENKAEELAAYKEDLLNQISKDNSLLGNRLTDKEIKEFSGRSIEDIVAISSSLAGLSDKVSKVQAEKQEFLAEKHKGIDKEVAKLRDRLANDDFENEDDKQYIRDLINKQENLKKSFFEKDGAKTAELLTEDVKEGSNAYNLYREVLKDIPEDLPSKEKFDLFYIALRRISKSNLAQADMLDEDGNYDNTSENALRDLFGVEEVLGVDFSGSIIGGLTTMEKEALEMKGKVDDLSNIFLNNTAFASENYWDELFTSFMGSLYPETAKASGLLSDTARAGETVATLDEFGITEGEGVDREGLQAFSDLVATPQKGLNFQKVGATLGGSFAMMGKLMFGGAGLKLLKVGKLGTAITKADKYLNKSKIGKVVSSSLKQGANAEFSGRLFNDKEELEFKQFFAGQMASDVIEGMLKKGPGKIVSVLIKNFGMNTKAAFDFTGKVLSRAGGEFTEESMQQIVGAYNKSDSFKETAAELRKQFPDMNSVTEFAILTGLMGATFGLKTSYTDVRQRLIDGGYDVKKADTIMDQVAEEYKKAAEIINEGKGEEGHFTKVTDKKSPIKGGDTFTVGEDSYQINKIDKDFNAHVTINGEEKVLSKEELSKLRRDSSFELFREAKAPVEAKETVTEPTAEVVEEAPIEAVTPAEVVIDETGEAEIKNKKGEFFEEWEVLKMTPESLSNMVFKNPSDAVQAKLAEVAGESIQEQESETTGVAPETETKTETDESVQPSETKTEDETETVQAEEVASEPTYVANDEEIVKGRTEEEVEKGVISFYHGGMSEDSTIDDVDLERKASKQQKKGRNYVGFYMNNSDSKSDSEGYAKGGVEKGSVHKIEMAEDAKVADIGGNIERVTKETLKEYKDQGFDVLKGKNVWGRTEYVLLNKDKVKSFSKQDAKTETAGVETQGDGKIKQEKYSGDISMESLSESGLNEDVSDISEKLKNNTADLKVDVISGKDFGTDNRGTNNQVIYILHSEGKKIGILSVNDKTYRTKKVEGSSASSRILGVESSISGVVLHSDLKGKGLGKEIYRYVNNDLISKGKSSLKSDYDITPAALRVWESLVKSGEAVRIGFNEKYKVPLFEMKSEASESKTAGETKEEVKTEKQIKAEAKKAKKLEVAKKAETLNNRLVSNVDKYNKMSDTKKKSKVGQDLLSAIQASSGKQGNTISQKGKNIVVTDSKGKKIKDKNEFAPKADPNEWVSQEVSSTDETWAEREVNNGLLDGDPTTGRIHLEGLRSTGLSAADIAAGVKQIKKGNLTSVSAKRVIAGLADARKKGVYEISDGKGGLTGVPIDEVSTRELTEEEVLSEEEINAEMEVKAEEQTKAKKILDARDSFVEAVRKMKYKPPGSFQSGGPLEIYNGALELIAKTIYAGGSTAAAVSKAMAAIKASDWYKKKLPAERKKIKAEAEADLIKRAEEINELAKIEKAKVEGTKKEAKKAKSKEKKQAKKKERDLLDDAYDALGETRDELSQKSDSRGKKIRSHILTMLVSPNISEGIKRKLRLSDDIRYNVVKNQWSQKQAVELVKAFSETEGGLELLLEDVEKDFLKYGQVGIWVFDSASLHYQAQGRETDATDVGLRKIKVAEILGRSFQALGHTAPDNIMDAMMYTAFTEVVQAKDRLKHFRESKISKKQAEGDAPSNEVFNEVRDELGGALDDISNHPQFKDAVDKAIADHVKKEKAAKKEAKEKVDTKNTFSARKAKLKADRKKIKDDFKKGGKNIFYSSVIPMLTPEGIEYAGDIAKTYVKSGILKASEIASEVRNYFKKEHGTDLSDSDILKVLNNIDVEKGVQESKDESSKKLADKVIDHVSKKNNKKTSDAVEILIRNLFAKAKDSLPKQTETESDTDYKNKLIKAMQQQTFAKEVWDGSRNTVVDILNNKEANGKITGGEKGKILKDLEAFFGDEVGMPFSETLLEQSLKEQIKSDGEKISDIVKNHYSKVTKGGQKAKSTTDKARSLAEKIASTTELSSSQSDELALSLMKQFDKMIEPYAERALIKILGIESFSEKALAKVKDNRKVVLADIMTAIHLGSLTDNSFKDAFATRFNFAKLSDRDVQRLNSFIYDISHLAEKSIARDKAFIEFRTYLKDLEKDNESAWDRYYYGAATSFFYQHILGNPPTVLRSVYGVAWSGGLQMLTEFVKNPRLYVNGLRALFKDSSKNMEEQTNNFRVMGTMLKGIMKIGPNIVKDAWKEGYVPYESSLEGARDAHTSLGVLDKLSNEDWKKPKNAKMAARLMAKLYETAPSKMLRMLFATDAVAHYAVRKGHVVTSVYNKILREGAYSSPYEKGFWAELDEKSGNTDKARKNAEKQVFEEMITLKAAGVDTKNVRFDQRVEEVIFENLDEDVQIEAETKSKEMRLGHHPKGSFGFVYNLLSKFISPIPGAMFIIPFLKIPLNLADSSTDYIPFLGLHKAFLGRGVIGRGLNKSRGGNFIAPDHLIEKSGSTGEDIAENRMDYLIKQGIGFAVTGATMAAVLGSFDLEDDDPWKLIDVTYKMTGSHADDYLLEREKGMKRFHVRFKVPGTDDGWGPWLDYRDSALGPIFAFAGGMSDKLKYDREDYNKVVTVKEMWEAADVAKTNAVFFFKEQNFLQSVGDVFRVISSEKTAGTMTKKYLADQAARATKGIAWPSVYSTSHSWKQSIFNDYKAANVKIQDSDYALSYMVDKIITNNFFLHHMKEDYRDNLGQKVRVRNKLPFVANDMLESFQDIVGIKTDKGDIWNGFLSNTKLKKDEIAPDVVRNRELIYKRSENEVPLSVREDFKAYYDLKVLEQYMEAFSGSEGKETMKELKKDDKKYKAYLVKLRKRAYNQVFNAEDSPWRKLLLKN